MIISVKASSSSDVGRYLTERDEAAFTVIEGDAKRIDAIADLTLKNNPKKKIALYSYVLSFKETHLTKDDLMDAYFKFREMMFKNYNQDELEIFSVIHWDDNKPHIHCAVINSSQLDNDKDLRLYRGYADFPRIEAIQEIINYKNDLLSPFDNYNILSLTKEQKKRDWLVKKGGEPYPVFDDKFMDSVQSHISRCSDFNDFMGSLKKEFGECDIFTSNKFNRGGFGKNTLLKESTLILREKTLPDGGNYIYNSKLFDSVWFNKNLKKMKDALEITSLDSIKFKTHRKSLVQYNKIYKQTSDKHFLHLAERGVGEKHVNTNKNKILDDNLKVISALDPRTAPREVIEANIERYLDYSNEKYLKKFVDAFPLDYVVKKDSIRYTNEDSFIEIYNDKLVSFYKNMEKNRSVSSGNKKLVSKEPETVGHSAIRFDENEFITALEKIQQNKNKVKARLLLEELLYKEMIKSRVELEAVLKRYGLSVLRSGSDVKSGNYLTLQNNHGKFSFYNEFAHTLYNNKKFPQETLYKNSRDAVIENDLKGNFISCYVKSVYLDIVKKDKEAFINTVNDYRLHKSPVITNGFIESNGMIFTRDYVERKKHALNDFEKVIDFKNGSFQVEKSLTKFQSGKNLADLYYLRGAEDVYISADFDEDLKKGFIERTKEMDYNLSLWDKDANYLNGSSLIFNNSLGKNINQEFTEKTRVKTEIDKEALTKEVQDGLQADGGVSSIMDIIRALESLDMQSKAGIKDFRNIIKDLNRDNAHLFSAICSTMGIEPVRIGKDQEKGIYATFTYKDKKVSVYDDGVAKIASVARTDLKETLVLE